MDLVVGRIGRAHGVRGEVTVEVRTDDPDTRFAVGSRLRTDAADRGPLTVAEARPGSGGLIVAFDGVADRTAADALRGTLLVVDAATLPPLDDPDEFYDHQLVDLTAVLPDGSRLGTVSEVVHGPGGDLLAIRAENEADGRDSGGPKSGGPEAGGLESGGPESGGREAGGPESGGPESGGPESGGPDAGGRESGGREYLVPFVRAIVPTVDIAGGRIVIDPPPGLLEL